MTLHQQLEHPIEVEDCFACRIGGVQFGQGTNVTKKGAAQAEYSAKFEKRLERDRPAYKAMKDQGLQPARLMGSHELMTKAETSFEIESGHLMPGKAKEIESVVGQFKDATGHKITQSSAEAK